MKFLLFFVSLIFSLIFYIFYGLNIGKDLFLNKIFNSVELISLSGNLLIESIIFFAIGTLFVIMFTGSDKKNIKTDTVLKINNNIVYYLCFYSLLIFLLYLNDFILNILLIISLIFFVLSDLFFNFFYRFNNNINFRYIGLLLNYISSIISVYYILNNEEYLISILILLFNIIYNINIHKNYTNYISLLISIISIGFLFYILYFWLFELYILYT